MTIEQYQAQQVQILPLIKDPKLQEQLKTWQLDQPLAQKPFQILFSGQWNAGKSSLINALIGQKQLLPTAPLPETARITHIQYGESLKYYTSKTAMEAGQASDIQAAFQEIRTAHQTDEIWVQTPMLTLENSTLIDMPGSNAPIEAHQKLVEEYIPNAQLLIYVISAHQPIQQMDIIQLKYLQLFIPTEQIYLVFSRSSDLSVEERLEIQGRVKKRLPGFEQRSFFVDSPLFFKQALSANQAQHDMEDLSGIQALHAFLQQQLAQGRESMLLQGDLLRLQYLAQQQYFLNQQALNAYQQVQKQSLDELKENKKKRFELEDEIKTQENELKEILHVLEAQGDLALQEKLEQSHAILFQKYQEAKAREGHLQGFQQEVSIYLQTLYQQHCEEIFQSINQKIKESGLKLTVDEWQKENQLLKLNLMAGFHQMPQAEEDEGSLFDYIKPILIYIEPFLPKNLKILVPIVDLFAELFSQSKAKEVDQQEDEFDMIYAQISQKYPEFSQQFNQWFQSISQAQISALSENTIQVLILQREVIDQCIADLKLNQNEIDRKITLLLEDLTQLKPFVSTQQAQ